MNKIILIIKREYFTRIQKKSFWIATILTPLLITAIYAIPIWLALRDKEVKKVEFFDQSGLFDTLNIQSQEVKFNMVKGTEESLKKNFLKSGYDALVVVPKDILTRPDGLKIYAENNISIILQSQIENIIQKRLRKELLAQAGINKEVYEKTQVDVSGSTIVISDQGDEKSSSSGGVMILGGILAFFLYITVFVYGSQVMNGVIEEKSNRIIEVIVSSVKPFQLMLGKIIGVGLVGLTQFLLWGILTFSFTNLAQMIYGKDLKKEAQTQMMKNVNQDQVKKVAQAQESDSENPLKILDKVKDSVNIPLLIGAFLFYYFFGYLLYSSLFAAIGSAVETAAEAQQFTLPVTLPIIVSFILGQFTIQDPQSTIAFWASIIPFTSPINMIVRLPYGVPTHELIVSMVLLFLGFLGTTWISARVYRVGILMYGKKLTWKDISKWIFYKG